jgi:hypothetical protein
MTCLSRAVKILLRKQSPVPTTVTSLIKFLRTYTWYVMKYEKQKNLPCEERLRAIGTIGLEEGSDCSGICKRSRS